MITNKPIEIDGNIYDRYSVTLAITSCYRENEEADASVSMRVIPTRIETQSDGKKFVKTDEKSAISFFKGHISEIVDPDEQMAFLTIQNALQTLLKAKGF